MPDTICTECKYKIQFYNSFNNIRCNNCGAYYMVESKLIVNSGVEFMYNFIEFKCTYSFMEPCLNVCPMPYMFCKSHITEECAKQIKSSYIYASNALQRSKDRLKRIQESKKTWVITRLSGIDEKRDSISKDKNE